MVIDKVAIALVVEVTVRCHGLRVDRAVVAHQYSAVQLKEEPGCKVKQSVLLCHGQFHGVLFGTVLPLNVDHVALLTVNPPVFL